jgi:7-cyano-7-deazaguanine synthase in queuosine biosynthesis
MLQAGAKRVVLLSGGADSASGALISRAELGNQEQILVSHRGSKPIAPIQRDVAEAVRASVSGGSQQHIQVGFLRRKKQPNGYNFRNESSTRSRSLLFLAFGLAVASVEELPLWIPENGFASLNPPLGPERRGSLSTRTTHPYFLSELKAILDSVGAHSNFTNPFEDLTKGEMFRRVAEIVGKDVAADVLSKTHSCSTANQRFSRTSTKIQCGVCFSCVIRRSSFMAAGLEDGTEYMDGSADASIQKWLDDRSIDRSMRDFLRRGIQAKDITSMPLPRYYSRSDALELCRKGQEEIRRLYT